MRWKIGFVVVVATFLLIAAIVSAQTKGGGFSDASGVQDGWNANSVVFEVGINNSPARERLSKVVSEAKEKATPTPSTNTKNTTTSKTLEGMVKIPAGWFYMGCVPSDSTCYDNEKPRKRVYLDSFYMDVYEVTQTKYQRVMGKNPSHFKNCSNCPVETVSWNDAQSYCTKVGKGLPTEAQWEYAARGGNTGERYGNLDSIAWYRINSGSKTHPVGQKQPNAYGLYDTLGNAYEWCEDWYDANYYSRMAERNPENRTKATFRVLRGGGWSSLYGYIRASDRGWFVPTDWNDFIGFRCSRD